MRHTPMIEAGMERLLQSPTFMLGDDPAFEVTKRWASEGGVRMTDDELRGALTALECVWHTAEDDERPGLLGLLSFVGAVLTRVNRSRELTKDEEAEILATLEALVEAPDADA